MKWYEIHDNQIKLVRYLVRVHDFGGEDLLHVVESWWKWEPEYREALAWHTRQQAMFQGVVV